MNGFGRIFRMSIYGESHGPQIGVVIDGCPPGVALDADAFAGDLARRRGGSAATTARVESDRPMLMSGVFNGVTTGAPIHIAFENNDVDSSSYEAIRHTPRPGHADFAAFTRSGGRNDYRGSGHFSGRITAALVAAGVVAKRIITPVRVAASVVEAGGRTDVDAAAGEAALAGDSIGGIVECRATGLPVGAGEPFFDPVESVIGHLAFSIPGVKAIEFGAGFACARMRGSAHNDPIVDRAGRTATNHAGGINGGLANGNELVFRVAVRPAASIALPQATIDLRTGGPAVIAVGGRHDACIALRVPPVLEAVTAAAIADLLMVMRGREVKG